MKIDFDDLELLFKLQNREHMNDINSCFDYIDCIVQADECWIVGLFIEPVGLLQIKTSTLRETLGFWLELLQSQPKDWNYTKAGWHLLNKISSSVFDAKSVNPRDIWKL